MVTQKYRQASLYQRLFPGEPVWGESPLVDWYVCPHCGCAHHPLQLCPATVQVWTHPSYTFDAIRDQEMNEP